RKIRSDCRSAELSSRRFGVSYPPMSRQSQLQRAEGRQPATSVGRTGPLERLVNVMSVDVEEHFQVAAFDRQIRPVDWGSQPSRVEANADRNLHIFADHGVQATFFILGWVAERYPALVCRIAAAGHEVASHGYAHQPAFRQTREVFAEDAQRSK